MKVTQALYDKLQPGDLVKIKTPGQLIDSGWKMFGLKTFYCLWDDNNDIHIIHDFCHSSGKLSCRIWNTI